MRNKVFKAMCKVPMNLQLFAEGGDGAGTGDEGGNGGGAGGAGVSDGNEPLSFDDFLKPVVIRQNLTDESRRQSIRQ